MKIDSTTFNTMAQIELRLETETNFHRLHKPCYFINLNIRHAKTA